MLRFFRSPFLTVFLLFAAFSALIAAPNDPPILSQRLCQLPPPSQFEVTLITPTSITMTWAPSTAAVGYRIKVKNLTTNENAGTIFTTDFTATKYGLIPGNLYLLQISSKCPDGTYGPSASRTAKTDIIIVDVIVQRCCNLPTTPDTVLAGVKDTFYLTADGLDVYSFKAEKYNQSTTYYDFCVRSNPDHSLRIEELAKSNTFVGSNTGAKLIVKYGASSIFLTVDGLSYNAFTNQMAFRVTWNTKMRVFGTKCGTGPAGQPEDRAAVSVLQSATTQFAPNPFDEVLRVSLNASPAQPAELRLFDLSGRAIFRQKTIEPTIVIPTAEWREGMYWVRIESDAGVITRRVVKIKG